MIIIIIIDELIYRFLINGLYNFCGRVPFIQFLVILVNLCVLANFDNLVRTVNK